jgi:hypothetical protein
VKCTNLVIGHQPPRLQIHDDPNHSLAEPAIADVMLDQDNDTGFRWQYQPNANNDSAMNASDAATKIENDNLEADV